MLVINILYYYYHTALHVHDKERITFAQDHLDADLRINERRVLYPVLLQKFLVLVAERGFLAGSILEVRLKGVVLQANQPTYIFSIQFLQNSSVSC